MSYIYTDLGHIQSGDTVEVTLSKGANVRIMNTANFNNYKSQRQCRFLGGLAKVSPLRIQVPATGRWHAVVDMQGLVGSTSASIRVLPR